MNPIPITWCLGAAAAALVLGGLAGWTVRDWKRDSEVLAGVTDATKKLDAARVTVDKAATAYEQEKVNAVGIRETRESEIRTYYRDRPVPGDCATGEPVRRVLEDAVRDANARAAGQPAPGLPTPAGGAGAAD